MASTYVPDPTATQAPAAKPEPDSAGPSLSLVADGDFFSAASIAQGFKALGDAVAWLFKPRAKASAWTQPIARWRNAQMQERFLVDHCGYPGGSFVELVERWHASPFPTAPLASYNVLWLVALTGTGSAIAGESPSTDVPFYQAKLTAGGSAVNDGATVGMARRTSFISTSQVVVEWPAVIGPPSNTRVQIGLTGSPTLGPSLSASAFFEALPGGGTWKARVRTAGGATTDVDTGVTPVGFAGINVVVTRFRIELHAAGASDDGALRALFFINGALVANITANVPAPGGSTDAHPVCPFAWVTRQNAVAGDESIYLGPMRLQANY